MKAKICLLTYTLITSFLVKASDLSTTSFFNGVSDELLLKIVTIRANPSSQDENPFPAMPLVLTCKQFNAQGFRELIVTRLEETFQKGALISLLPSFMQQKIYQSKIEPKQNYANILIDFCFDTIQKSNFEQLQQLFLPQYSLLNEQNIINSVTQEKIATVTPKKTKTEKLTIKYPNHTDKDWKNSKKFKKDIINRYLETIKNNLNDILYYSLNDQNTVSIETGRLVEILLKKFICDHKRFEPYGAAQEYWSTFGVGINALSSSPDVNLELLTKRKKTIAQELDEEKQRTYPSKTSNKRIQESLCKEGIHQESKDEKEIINSFIKALLYMNQKQ